MTGVLLAVVVFAGATLAVGRLVPTGAWVVVRDDMDPELAYQLTKMLFERKDDLVKVHQSAKQLDVEKAQDVAPLELHPGAKRYYDEAGAKQ